MLNELFYQCVKTAGIVSVASASKEGKPHVVNTWNRLLTVTEDEKILIPCAGYNKTEENIANDPYIEVTVGSNELGHGFLLTGKGELLSSGPLFDRMRAAAGFGSRVLVFTPETCEQTL